MKTKKLFPLLLTTVLVLFFSCSNNNDDIIPDGTNNKKGVHKVEVTVSSESSDFVTVLSYAGIGKDGINANASLYDETGTKCGDGSYTRKIENKKGKFICYTKEDARGLICVAGVAALKPDQSVKILCVAYIDNKEVSRIERTFTDKENNMITINTTSQD